MKLLLTFLVLDSATLASVRSTSSKMMDCTQDANMNVKKTTTGKHEGIGTNTARGHMITLEVWA